MSDKMPETQRAFISQNPNQGNYKRVLCICTGGILRSPTAAWVLSNEPYSFNTRSAGTEPFALIRLDKELLGWADEVVCMEEKHRLAIERMDIQDQIHYPKGSMPPIRVLGIPDDYEYRDPALIKRIRTAYEKETR
jgi:predicted protein tyrosine phosphatase